MTLSYKHIISTLICLLHVCSRSVAYITHMDNLHYKHVDYIHTFTSLLRGITNIYGCLLCDRLHIYIDTEPSFQNEKR